MIARVPCGIFCAALLMLLVSGAPVGRAQDNAPPRTTWSAARFAPVAQRVRAAAAATLLEGLPHQLVEHGLYLQELRTRKTVEIAGYAFYQRPLPLADADREALRGILSDPGAFHPYTGPKRCGGFHPDYALVWGRGRQAERVLICFGCHEILTTGNEHDLIADLPAPTYARLRTILSKYHAQRPPFTRGG